MEETVIQELPVEEGVSPFEQVPVHDLPGFEGTPPPVEEKEAQPAPETPTTEVETPKVETPEPPKEAQPAPEAEKKEETPEENYDFLNDILGDTLPVETPTVEQPQEKPAEVNDPTIQALIEYKKSGGQNMNEFMRYLSMDVEKMDRKEVIAQQMMLEYPGVTQDQVAREIARQYPTFDQEYADTLDEEQLEAYRNKVDAAQFQIIKDAKAAREYLGQWGKNLQPEVKQQVEQRDVADAQAVEKRRWAGSLKETMKNVKSINVKLESGDFTYAVNPHSDNTKEAYMQSLKTIANPYEFYPNLAKRYTDPNGGYVGTEAEVQERMFLDDFKLRNFDKIIAAAVEHGRNGGKGEILNTLENPPKSEKAAMPQPAQGARDEKAVENMIMNNF